MSNVFSEEEKARRWQEIRIRQHRLRSSGFHRGNPMEQSMLKSGFTREDIKGNKLAQQIIVCSSF